MVRGTPTKREASKHPSKRPKVASPVSTTASQNHNADSAPRTRGQPPASPMLPLFAQVAAMPPKKRSERLKAGAHRGAKPTDTDVKAKGRAALTRNSFCGPGSPVGGGGSGVEWHDRNHRTRLVPPVDRPILSSAPLADHHLQLRRRSSTIGSTLLAQVRQCVKCETEKWGRRPFVMDVVLDLKSTLADRVTLLESTMTMTATEQALLVCDNGERDAPDGADAPCYYRTYDLTDMESLDLYLADQRKIWGSLGQESIRLERRGEIVISGDGDGKEEPEDIVGEWVLGARIASSRFPISRERSTVTWPPEFVS